MSEGRNLTLRKRGNQRPQISAPQPSTGPSPVKSNTLAVPREHNGPSQTSDIVKRRYSTRYNQLPDFSNGAPAVPALPGQLKRSSRGGSPRRPQASALGGPLQLDSDILNDPNLQHERYVTELVGNASEREIQEFQKNLRRTQTGTAAEIQHSVYQNRTQFIKISKEAEKLKTEMTVLRGLMSELTGALGHTGTENANGYKSPSLNGDSFSKRAGRRTSVANLESMWNIQLQTLWKNVERSQKFLPAVPGRHIMMETGRWIELDSATWKPKRPVHIVLLNDHLLIASKKRKRMDPNAPQAGPAPTKLVAEECWPLQDVDVLDLTTTLAAAGGVSAAEQRAVATALTFRSGAKTLTYRHDKREDSAKIELLLTFRKAVEDLRKSALAENDKHGPQVDTLNYFASRDPASAKKPEIMESINSAKEKPDPVVIEIDGKQQTLRWVESQIDELDIDIALQRWDSAVEKVEKLRSIGKGLKGNKIAQDLVLAKVEERSAKIASTLGRELVDNPAFLEATKKTTSLLSRLGFEDRAREIYLNARSESLTKLSKQCVFEGDLHRYLFQLSYVYFTIIKNTVLIYQACFAPVMMSACIKWANDRLERFNAILTRQLSTVDRGGKVWKECLEMVWVHEREMLGESGLDFREVIGRGLDGVEVVDFLQAPPPQERQSSKSRSRSKSRARTQREG